MIECSLKILNEEGLHARPASLFVKLASGFAADITVKKEDIEVNGKSIMGLMMLAACQNETISVIFNGDDEISACEAIKKLINSRFDEK